MSDAEARVTSETIAEEMALLDSIYGSADFEQHATEPLWRVRLADSSGSKSSQGGWVEFYVPPGSTYPNEFPVIVIRHPTLTPSQRLSALQQLIQHSGTEGLGAPLSYSLVSLLLASLYEFSTATASLTVPLLLTEKFRGRALVNPLAATSTSTASATPPTSASTAAAVGSASAAASEPGASAKRAANWDTRPARRLRNDEPTNIALKHDLLDVKPKNTRYSMMQARREQLPAHAQQADILQRLRDNAVVVISGETGCGKSTQVPQFVLDDCIRRGLGSVTNIVVTQVRGTISGRPRC